MKKILMVLTSVSEIGDTGEKTGYNVVEAAHPWKVFNDSGHFVDFASIQGGQPPRDEVDAEDPIQVAFTEDETTRAGLYNTARVDVVDPDQYDAVFLVGGHGTMWDFPDSQCLQSLVASVYNAGGLVGAVCHGPAGLLNVELENRFRLVEGRKVAASTNDGAAVNCRMCASNHTHRPSPRRVRAGSPHRSLSSNGTEPGLRGEPFERTP
ncbi:type 1 glutamine amidotransferase domain-containing protein [Arthrobacter sp. ok362]|uniref:type 1 glutamine amidotransferase domain-containing protein n=1 Tax=Arthrobacter sp. ok362 TaxID=1761745 RepID=UPI0008856C97|nr:type 1 glutamine amidotransferase domain-containing protein [Arthrobacter sp. ok362]SDL32675.1 DJ-1/PfpI family protein [Arthrobacter sp. ok362]